MYVHSPHSSSKPSSIKPNQNSTLLKFVWLRALWLVAVWKLSGKEVVENINGIFNWLCYKKDAKKKMERNKTFKVGGIGEEAEPIICIQRL